MGYNHGKAEAAFQKQWQEKRIAYVKLGMTEEQINSIYDYERSEFNSDRRFFENTICLEDTDFPNMHIRRESSLCMNPGSWIEEMEDENTYLALKALPEIKIRAYTLYKLYGYTQKEISSILLKPQQTISLWIGEIAEILKKSKFRW